METNMAADPGNLTRRQAIRRRGYNWKNEKNPCRFGSEYGGTTSGRVERKRPRSVPASTNRCPLGSSVDLTPSLLSMYDKLTANGSQPSLQNGGHDDNPSPISPEPHSDVKHLTTEEIQDSETMDSTDSGVGHKRPLSVGSTSSSSSSSLPMQYRHKRPNLGEYEHMTSAKGMKPTLLELADSSMSNASTDSLSVGDDWSETRHPDNEEEEDSYYEQIDLSAGPLSLPVVKVYSPQSSTGSNDDVSLNSAYSEKGDNSPSEPVQSTFSLKLVNNSQNGTPSVRISGSNLTTSRVTDRNSNGSLHSPVLSKDSSYYVSYAQRVASEIVETEKTYVHSLVEILEGYMKHILQCKDITEQQSKQLFGNLEDIYEFNKGLLVELDECGEDPVEVARCFVEKNEGFDIYTEYCTNYPASMEVLTKCMMQPALAEKFKSWQAALGHGLPLGAYLLKPVQRILKYHLLLQNIVKHYDPELPGYDTLTTALDQMTHMAHHINEMKRRHEHAVRVQEVQSQLEDYDDGPDLSTLGELVLEGCFRLLGAKASRSVFLFEKGILITKRKEEGTFSCKAVILCSNLMLVESVPKEPLSFHVIPFDNVKIQYTLQAHSIEMKRKWCLEIKRLILESYRGKIPDKVKNLVLGIGRTRAEEEELNNHSYLSPEQNDKKRPRRKSAHLMDLVKIKKGHRKSDTTPPRLTPPNAPIQASSLTSSGNRNSAKQNNKSLSGSRSMDNLSLSGSHTLPRSKLPSFGEDRDVEENIGEGDGDSVGSPIPYYNSIDPNPARRAKSFKIATRMNPVTSIEISDNDVSSGESMEVSTDDENLEDDVYVNLVSSNNNIGEDGRTSDDFTNLNYGTRGVSMPTLNADVDDPDYVMVQLRPDNIIPVSSQSHVLTYSHDNASKSAECLLGDNTTKQNGNVISESIEHTKDPQLCLSTASSYDNLHKRWSSSSAPVEEEVSEECEEGVQSAVVPPPAQFADPVVLPTPDPPQNDQTDSGLTDPWVKQTPGVVIHTPKKHQHLEKSFSFPLYDKDTARCLSKENFDWFVYSNKIASSLSKQFNKLQMLEKQGLCRRTSVPCQKYPGYVTDREASDKYSLEQRKVIVQYGTPPRGAFSPQKMNQYAALYKDCKSDNETFSTRFMPKTKPKPQRSSSKAEYMLSTPQPWQVKGDKSGKLKPGKDSVVDDPNKMVEEMENYAEKHGPKRDCYSGTVKFPSTYTSPYKHKEEKFRKSSDLKLSSDKHKEFKLPGDKHKEFRHPDDKSFKLPNDYKFQGDRNSDTWSQKSRDSFSSGGNFMSKSRESLSSSTSSLNKLKSSQESMSDTDTGPGKFRSKLSHLTSWLTARKQLPNINSVYNPPRSAPTGQYKSTFNARYKPQNNVEHKPQGFVSHLTRIYNAREENSPPRSLPKKIENSTPEKRLNYASVLRERQLGSPALGSRLAASAGIPEPKVRSLPRQLTAPPNLASDGDTTSETTSVHSLDFTKEKTPDSLYNVHVPSNNIQQCDSALSIQSHSSARETPLSPSSGRRSSCGSIASSTDSIYERRFSRTFEEPEDNVFRDSAVYSDIDSMSNYAVPPTALSTPRKSIREVVQQLEERARPKQPEVLDVRRREPGRSIQEKLKSLRESSEYRRRTRNFEEEIDGFTRPLREFRRSLGSSRSSVDREESPGFTIRYSRGYPGQEAGVKMTRSTGRLDQLDTDVPTLTTMKGWVRQLISKFQGDQ